LQQVIGLVTQSGDRENATPISPEAVCFARVNIVEDFRERYDPARGIADEHDDFIRNPRAKKRLIVPPLITAFEIDGLTM
jgi:hypothetical protein